MIRFTVTHPLRNVYQWLLKTSDTYGMYGKCGFVPFSDADHGMVRMQLRSAPRQITSIRKSRKYRVIHSGGMIRSDQ